MTARTKLADRVLPDYTKCEEMINMITHIVGAALGIAALVLCVIFSAKAGNPYLVVASSIYGASLILLYTMSSIYHGLRPNMGKKVLQVLDHCTIYFLIGGTYMPIVLGPLRSLSPALGWVMFGAVWLFCIIGITFTAIDLKKFRILSMICYIGIGWMIITALKKTIEAISLKGFSYLILGGIFYTIGAVLYALGKNHRYMHSVFHVFVLVGSICHFFCIFFYCIP